jgi:phosphatidylinositol alpha-1,6-mannosyltransferase
MSDRRNKPIKRNCLALVTDAFGGTGGIAQYNRDFLGALAALPGISTIEILPRHGRTAANLPPGLTQRPPRPDRLRYGAAALSAACRRPNLVFCGHLYMAPLAAMLARLCPARLLVQMHGVEALPPPTSLQRRAVEAADLVLCVSRDTRDCVLAWSRIAPERVAVIPDTVGEAFRPGADGGLRAKLGLAGKRVLLTVGRLDPRERYKGQDRVIRIVPELVARGHDIAYVIIGEGEDRRRLEALAHECGVAGRLRWLGGVPTQTLLQAYRMADLYVMPSSGEGFGIAFIEAMACGTPAVGLAAAGARDALANGALGTAVAEPDLAPAIHRLLSDRRPAAEALANRTHARFGHEPFRRRVEAVLHRLSPPANLAA